MAQDHLPTSPSRQVLEDTPPRALKFLGAVGRVFGIRTALAERGYDAEEHRRAWNLLHQVSGFRPEQDAGISHAMEVRSAVSSLDDWDDASFRIAEAALKHRHPEQHAFLFDSLSSGQGEFAVLAVARFLERLDALENSPDREATREADHAALQTLAKRGIDAAERARLQDLVDVAQGVDVPPAADTSERRQQLLELFAWLEEWTETAKAVITRRDHLIALGIAKRRPKKKAEAEPQTTTTA